MLFSTIIAVVFILSLLLIYPDVGYNTITTTDYYILQFNIVLIFLIIAVIFGFILVAAHEKESAEAFLVAYILGIEEVYYWYMIVNFGPMTVGVLTFSQIYIPYIVILIIGICALLGIFLLALSIGLKPSWLKKLFK